MPYKWEDSMIQKISGMGGEYEQTCRNMLIAGMNWLEEHPQTDPQFHGYKGIYGIITEDNKDAKDLTEAVFGASNNDCTGAMHQAVIESLFWIRNNGWEKYRQLMLGKNKENGDD